MVGFPIANQRRFEIVPASMSGGRPGVAAQQRREWGDLIPDYVSTSKHRTRRLQGLDRGFRRLSMREYPTDLPVVRAC